MPVSSDLRGWHKIIFYFSHFQGQVVQTGGLLMENLASSSSTFQHWSGVPPEEIARSWAETSLKSPRLAKTSSSTTFFSSRKKLQFRELGWDFTARQTTSSTGQTTLRWPDILHGTLVNRTIHQLRGVAICMV